MNVKESFGTVFCIDERHVYCFTFFIIPEKIVNKHLFSVIFDISEPVFDIYVDTVF